MNYQILVNKDNPISKEDIQENVLYPIIEREQLFYLDKKVIKQYLKLKSRVWKKTGKSAC